MTTSVFINEVHYDNEGTDTGEFVEILAPLGQDLTGWTLLWLPPVVQEVSARLVA